VFHTNASHVTLHDKSYNADRNIATGNPYKELVNNLMKRGVQVELCGATAKVHGWGNADLLPGVKVNTDAMARTDTAGSGGVAYSISVPRRKARRSPHDRQRLPITRAFR